ncbi:GvpL/GvpF family gas vesicle protein [Rhodococcus opacus]|uniref:GvpL/GvpF family gas vesicle protein n=1 Tax=Rhodococcus opacus TaxID=37919 RepID=UPI002475B05F|nr:GvpL/GvpF family gas vesicle protein [Rhodococcus opacus]MDH6291743.1 hypothetical protein [Rhodococcus opacus]
MTSADDTADHDTDEGASAAVIYVYGIVPADVQPEKDATGVHDAPIEIVKHGDIAALVSEIDPDQRLGAPADLQAHAHILDGTAHVAPVLPLRFGAVVSDRDAVIRELLAEHHDEDAVQIAVLFEVDRQEELEQTVGDLAARWDNRVAMRVLGPTAPYDFVVRPKRED